MIKEKHHRGYVMKLKEKSLQELYSANLYYELHIAEDKIKLFETKYNCRFEDFEKQVSDKSDENFDEWDDYIEWKAYEKTKEGLLKQKSDIEHGNYQFA